MRAGKLRNTIIVKDFINTPNPDGTPNEVWSEIFRVKANVIWLRGNSYLENYQYLYEMKGRAFTRSRSDILKKHRIEINGIDYDIESIMPVDNKNKEIEIVFKAVEI